MHARITKAAFAPLLIAGALVTVAFGTGTTDAAARHAAPRSTGCSTISGPFHTKGAAVLDPAGARYVPFGINLVGLGHPLDSSTVHSEERRVYAARHLWCANTVRLQVSQAQLVRNGLLGYTINAQVLTAVKTLVGYAEGQGLVVVLGPQTQNDASYDTDGHMPSARTLKFWDQMVALYGQDSHVVFDLFNEPAQTGTWANWRNGFTDGGVRYYGMQDVADRIRQDGAGNLLWVEGTARAARLAGVWQYRLTGVGPLAYAIHRPPGSHTVATWRNQFGFLAERDLAPVVEGEWAQYAIGGRSRACWADARTTVPTWFRYLQTIHAGMVVHKLAKGVLIQSSDLGDPTVMKSNWACRTGLDQGAGRAIMIWFWRRNGGQFPPALTSGTSIRHLHVARAAHGWLVTARLFRGGQPWRHHRVQGQHLRGGRWSTFKHARTNDVGKIVLHLRRSSATRGRLRLHVASATGSRASSSRGFRLSG